MRPLVSLSLVLLLVFAGCNNSPTEPKFPDAVLTGTVTYAETGAPVEGARITVYLVQIKGWFSAETRSDVLGHYSISAPGGQYSVAVYAPNTTKAAFIDQYDLVPGVNPMNFQISANGCVTMTGRVYDFTTNASVSGATITFLGQHVVSGSDGAFRMDLGCPPSSTNLAERMTVEHPNYQRRELMVNVPTYSTTTEIGLQPRL